MLRVVYVRSNSTTVCRDGKYVDRRRDARAHYPSPRVELTHPIQPRFRTISLKYPKKNHAITVHQWRFLFKLQLDTLQLERGKLAGFAMALPVFSQRKGHEHSITATLTVAVRYEFIMGLVMW